ncbi:MerR family transcriptional regulator [Elusimicrobiota bacterium]
MPSFFTEHVHFAFGHSTGNRFRRLINQKIPPHRRALQSQAGYDRVRFNIAKLVCQRWRRTMDTFEVGRQLGVASTTLRLWERRKLIGPIRRDARGWRVWSESDVEDCRRLLLRLHGANGKHPAPSHAATRPR